MRLIDRLQALYPEASRRSLRQWLATSRVRVNGAVVGRGDVEVNPGDRVALTAAAPPGCPAPLGLIHEDDDILVVDKPSGLLTIATERERERTAYRLLRDWVAGRGPETSRLFIVHRLDRETSGLIVLAKSVAAKEHLQAQFAARTAERAANWAWRCSFAATDLASTMSPEVSRSSRCTMKSREVSGPRPATQSRSSR